MSTVDLRLAFARTSPLNVGSAAADTSWATKNKEDIGVSDFIHSCDIILNELEKYAAAMYHVPSCELKQPTHVLQSHQHCLPLQHAAVPRCFPVPPRSG